MAAKGVSTFKLPLDLEPTVAKIARVQNPKWKMLLILMLFTGRRMHDILRLKVEHFEGDFINIHESKTGKHISVAISPIIQKHLDLPPDGNGRGRVDIKISVHGSSLVCH